MWYDFYEYWKVTKVPVHWVRYEDVVHDTKNTMMEVMKFLLNKKDLKGRVIEKIVDIVLKDSVPTAYEPRNDGKLGANLAKYTQEKLQEYYEACSDLFDFLGYSEIFTQNAPKFDRIPFHVHNEKALE